MVSTSKGGKHLFWLLYYGQKTIVKCNIGFYPNIGRNGSWSKHTTQKHRHLRLRTHAPNIGMLI